MPSARRKQPVPDVAREGLDVLFVGINPGLVSAREGHHFANPANGFWRLLHESGFTARRLAPAEERLLLDAGLGITNLVARETPGVAELTKEDVAKGRVALARKIARLSPKAVVFVGLTAYRMFRALRTEPVACGEQHDRIAGARVFVVPNPSGRNAHFRYEEMLAAFREVASALGRR